MAAIAPPLKSVLVAISATVASSANQLCTKLFTNEMMLASKAFKVCSVRVPISRHLAKSSIGKWADGTFSSGTWTAE
jgi:hypothetical protein